VFDHYHGLVNCILVDPSDSEDISRETRSSIIIHATDILIPDKAKQVRLAKEILNILDNHL
jgi:hypothetical protein